MFRPSPAVALATSVLVMSLGVLAHVTPPARAATPAARPAAHAPMWKHATKVDLNTASRDELTKLPGIDEATADRILAARPFHAASELKSRKLVTTAEYAKIANRVTARAPSPLAK